MRIDDALDLLLVSGGDVGDGPTGLLADTLLGVGQEELQAGEGAAVDDHLCLLVVTRHDVANGAEGGGLNGGVGRGQQLDQPGGDVGIQDGLDPVVGTI